MPPITPLVSGGRVGVGGGDILLGSLFSCFLAMILSLYVRNVAFA
jgi:hypothetical protein